MAHDWSNAGGDGGGSSATGGSKAKGRNPKRQTAAQLKAQSDADFAAGKVPF